MLTGRHYQVAYVTRDLDAARALLASRATIRMEFAHDAVIPLRTPTGAAEMETRIALAWIDDLQVELIQPVGGHVDLYRDVLPAGDGLAFHHLALRVDDWDAFRRGVDDQPYPLVFEGEAGPLKFLYLDARRDFGHYLEYTWMPDDLWSAMGGR